jgi:hypothetical protein
MEASKINTISKEIMEIENILKAKNGWWGIHDNNNQRFNFDKGTIGHTELINILERERERLRSELKKQIEES